MFQMKGNIKFHKKFYLRLVCDLVWSDPEENEEDFGWGQNERGVSYTFNK